MRSLDTLEFAPRFAALGDAFSAPIKPTATEQAKMVICSPAALALLDLPASTADDPRLLQLAAGQWYWPDATPRAMVYSGHQFGGYTPQLGDGRGLLLAEVRNTAGEHWDVHLKGAGLTPFSRTASTTNFSSRSVSVPKRLTATTQGTPKCLTFSMCLTRFSKPFCSASRFSVSS